MCLSHNQFFLPLGLDSSLFLCALPFLEHLFPNLQSTLPSLFTVVVCFISGCLVRWWWLLCVVLFLYSSFLLDSGGTSLVAKINFLCPFLSMVVVLHWLPHLDTKMFVFMMSWKKTYIRIATQFCSLKQLAPFTPLYCLKQSFAHGLVVSPPPYLSFIWFIVKLRTQSLTFILHYWFWKDPSYEFSSA